MEGDHAEFKVAPIIANGLNHLREEEVERREEASRSQTVEIRVACCISYLNQI